MRCLACHGVLDKEGSLYHPKCVRKIWKAKRLPLLPDQLPHHQSSGYYLHKHDRGVRSTLESADPAEANIFIEIYDPHQHNKLLLQDNIACLLKFSKNLSGIFSLNDTHYYVQSLADVHSVESIILHHKESLPMSLEMMGRFIFERSSQAGVFKSQLFDLVVLSNLMGVEYLERMFGSQLTLDGQKKSWGSLELTILQSTYDLPPKYLERLLKKLESKSKQIAISVKNSRLSTFQKSAFFMEWKDSRSRFH